jgi:hypothetical protein
MGGDHVGIRGGRRRRYDPCLGLAGGRFWLRILDALGRLRYRLNGIFDPLVRPLGSCLSWVPLVILHRAMDLHQERFGGLES